MQEYGRFLKYSNTNDMILKIINTMNHKFPNWQKNKYFKNQSKIYKLTCNIFMRNKSFEISLYKLLKNFKNM